MRANRILFFLGVSSLALLMSGCEKTIELDLDQTPSKIVIEALVTNEEGGHYVKISRTTDFYQNGATEKVRDAIVFMRDDLGAEVSFVHNPTGNLALEGKYFVASDFKGEIGRTYHLTVRVGAIVFEAEDKLLFVTPIDSLEFDINEDEKMDPKKEGRYYETLLYAKEPQQTKDYYLIKFFRNDTLVNDSPSDVYFTNDEGIGEKIDGLPSPVYYSLNDKAGLEMYSLSRDGFLFYNDLSNLINSDGGMFGTPPANPRSNWSNGALGFFQVSSVSKANIIIE